ncbi:MAG: hypothetical protein KGD64_07200 [Candidatus Heimdallarchaeota archaeon]|nr:hypothetical protein [Candidatus Heimdallarchaeota archaeon]
MPVNWKKTLSISWLVSKIIFAVFFLIEWLATLVDILSVMSTAGEPEPILKGLGKIYPFTSYTDTILRFFLGDTIHHFLFKHWIMAGFFFSVVFLTLAMNHGRKRRNLRNMPWSWWGIILILILEVTILFISFFYAEPVPYAVDPSWHIDIYHKIQFSVTLTISGLFFVIYSSIKEGKKLNERAYDLCTTSLLYSIIFGIMTLEIIAGFPWFPGGYRDIFLYGQSWFSFDKYLHFMMSLAILLILWSLTKNKWISGAIVVGFHLLWELFEYGLQPEEIIDTLKDEIVNISAVIFAIIIVIFIEKRMKRNQEISEPTSDNTIK